MIIWRKKIFADVSIPRVPSCILLTKKGFIIECSLLYLLFSLLFRLTQTTKRQKNHIQFRNSFLSHGDKPAQNIKSCFAEEWTIFGNHLLTLRNVHTFSVVEFR